LKRRGVGVFISPMLTITFIDQTEPDLNGKQALLFTSANGVRAFARLCAERGLPVFAVGEHTATAAREEGFRTVQSAGGDVNSLAELVARACTPAAGALLHSAGTAVAGDLAGQLGADGFVVQRAVLYRAKPATRLSGEIRMALADAEIDIILFYSPRSAAIFGKLAIASGLELTCEKLEILCLSKAVAEAADVIMWRRVLVAKNPTQADLLDRLDERLRAP
jgi:uroporphyrinogen-III synthase